MSIRWFIPALAVFCAIFVAVPVRAADEIDLLFRDDSPAPAADLLTADFSSPEQSSDTELVSDRSEFDSTSHRYSAPAAWPGGQSEADMSSLRTDADLPPVTFAVNVVPEPSAVALAALALGYFLVFGRRHRIA